MAYRKAVFFLLIANIALIALQLGLVGIKAHMPLEILILYVLLAAALSLIAYFVWKNDNLGYVMSFCASIILIILSAASLFSVGILPCCQIESGSIAMAGIIISMTLATFSWVSRK